MTAQCSTQALPDERLHDGFVSGIRVLARLARVAEQTCQSERMSLPQYRLLIAASAGLERAGQLARAVGVTRPTLTALVDGLEESGLLRRVRLVTDRRGVRLEVTSPGRGAMARVERALAARLFELIQGDAFEVLAGLEDVVTDIGDSLDREGRGAG